MKLIKATIITLCLLMATPAFAKKIREKELPESITSVYQSVVEEDGWKFKSADQAKKGAEIVVTIAPAAGDQKAYAKEVTYLFDAEGNFIYRYWPINARHVPKAVYDKCLNTDVDKKVRGADPNCSAAQASTKRTQGFYVIDHLGCKFIRFDFVKMGKAETWFHDVDTLEYLPDPRELPAQYKEARERKHGKQAAN